MPERQGLVLSRSQHRSLDCMRAEEAQIERDGRFWAAKLTLLAHGVSSALIDTMTIQQADAAVRILLHGYHS